MAGPITLVVFISIRALADYDDDVAGGLMITEFVQVSEDETLGDTLDALVMNAEDSDDHFSRYVYVLSPLGRLVGVASSRRTPSQQSRSWASAVDCQA